MAATVDEATSGWQEDPWPCQLMSTTSLMQHALNCDVAVVSHHLQVLNDSDPCGLKTASSRLPSAQ